MRITSRHLIKARDSYDSVNEYGYSTPVFDFEEALQPLIDQLRKYDALRMRVERHPWGFSHMTAIAEMLSQEILIRGRFQQYKVALINQASLRNTLWHVGYSDLHLDVRQLDTHMPVYYLCRVRSDYLSEYGLVLEDMYKSPGYPVVDERFVKLMRGGHEVYYIRLSSFRKKLAATAAAKDAHTLRRTVDEVLSSLSRHVFQAAWHEDQRLGITVATHFHLPRFRDAIELLYLCLSGELCELRGAVNERMQRFFDEIYSQPAIYHFLDMLPRIDGQTLTDLPQRALKLYMKLSQAFSRFLNVEVTWGQRRTKVPLHKLIFGNFSRLDLVSKELEANKKSKKASSILENDSQATIDELLNVIN